MYHKPTRVRLCGLLPQNQRVDSFLVIRVGESVWST